MPTDFQRRLYRSFLKSNVPGGRSREETVTERDVRKTQGSQRNSGHEVVDVFKCVVNICCVIF